MPSYFAGVSCFLVVLKRTFNIGINETKDKALKSAYKALKKIFKKAYRLYCTPNCNIFLNPSNISLQDH